MWLKFLGLAFLFLIAINSFAAPNQQSSPQGGAGQFILSNKVPKGFENLNTESETILDVYYGNLFVGSYSALYSPSNIKFSDPAEITKALSNITNIALVQKALSGNLKTHSDLVCSSKFAQNCGVLTPPVAGIIFNPTKFRVDIFVNPNYVEKSKVISGLLDHSDAGFSYLNNLTTTVTGTGKQNSYNVNSQNIMAYYQGRMNANISYAKTAGSDIEQTQVNNLNAGWNYNRYEVLAGSIITHPDPLIPTENILGASWSTVKDTIKDKGNTFGSPLEVFLTAPSKVSVYREGRLIGSGFYAAGKQQIDTSTFPDGAYTVDMKIEGQNGVTTEEQQPFVKTAQIPPLQYPTYFVDVGYVQKNVFTQTVLPQYSQTLLMQAGFSKRFKPSWGYNGMLIGEGKNNFLTAGVFYINALLQVNPDFLLGNHGEHGVSLTSQLSFGSWFGSVYGSQIWAHYQPQNLAEAENLPSTEDDFSPIVGDSTNAGMSLSKTFNNISINMAGNVNKRRGQDTFYSYGPTLRAPVFSTSGFNVNLEVTATKTQNDVIYMATLRGFYRPTNSNWSHSLNLGYQHVDPNSNNEINLNNKSGLVASENSSWQKLDQAQEGLRLGVNANTNPDSASYGATGSYNWNYGNLDTQVQRNQSFGDFKDESTQYSATFSTRLAFTSELAAIGGTRYGDTGIIADVESSQPSDDKFEVIVDNQVRKIISINTPTPILLQPYDTYKVRIQAIGDSLFDYKENAQVITLYKGNLKSMVWQVTQKIVLFTKVVYANGKPVANKLIKGGIGLNETDADGSLQLEVASNTKNLEIRLSKNRKCQLALPKYQVEDGVALLDDLVCRPVSG
jgi:hypothetical protein